MTPLPIETMIPASGQGALAIQCRRDDAFTRQIAERLDHPPSRLCVQAERRVVKLLDGDCHSPIGAYAELADGLLRLRLAVGERGGTGTVKKAIAEGLAENWENIAAEAVARLIN